MIGKFIKILTAGIIFIIIAVLGYIIGNQIKYQLDIRKSDKSVERFQNALEEPYRNDTYGGKTPEETWGMFLDAQKREDIELAIKYFVVDKQKEWGKILKDTQDSEQLDEVLNNLLNSELKEEESNFSRSEKRYYILQHNQTKEIINNSVIFQINPYTKVWKIANL